MFFKSDEQIIKIAEYILKNNATVRKAGKFFGVSKSSIYKYMTYDLPNIDYALSNEIRKLLDVHLAERHIRGGESTQRIWMELNKNTLYQNNKLIY